MPSTCQNSELVSVTPVRPAAPWVGGKRNLAAQLVAIINEIQHRTYAEPFVGMGGVFFRRTMQPRCEVINDLNRNVSTFFLILREHLVPFADMLRFQLTTRSEFERLLKIDPDTLTDLQRSARFLYLQRTCFGGKVSGRNFGVDPGAPAAFDVSRVMPILEELHDRLKGVVIECLPYQDLIARYDRPDTLFYLDPPYEGAEHFYGRGLFTGDDFAALADLLANIKGKFVLSINDSKTMRATFARFNITPVKVTYTVSRSKAKAAGELIIRN